MIRHILLTLIGTLCMGRVKCVQPSVTVNASVVHGFDTQVGDTTVSQYLGIRFGQAPTGSLRFQKPVPAPLPAEVNATRMGSPCWGLFNNSLPMSEDCLFLNVFVPHRGQENGALPVMVWIHGGAFVMGSGTNYDGSLLAADGNVIVVALNYRLGPFGFLSTGDNSSIGNYGLWDQWLALTWVKDNIRAFGGDVNNITIFGESAGAASVNFQMTSPHSVGLFHRAVLQSGCRICSWAYNKTADPLERANTMAAALQCPTATHRDPESVDRMMTCLRAMTPDAISMASLVVEVWSPVTDGDFVLPYDEAPTFSEPVIVGINNYEGGLLIAALKLVLGAAVNSRPTYRIILKTALSEAYPVLATSADPRDVDRALDVLDCVYRVENSTDDFVPDEELAGLYGDSNIVVCSLQLLDTEPTTSSLYLYYFDHYPDIPSGENGMDHTWDIDYLFGFNRGLRAFTSPFSGVNLSQSDLDLSVSFRTLFTNFAKTGNPNQPANLDNWPVWPTYTKGAQSYLSVSANPTVASHVKKDTMILWTKTIPAILRSEGTKSLEQTRFRGCIESDRPTGSATFVSVGEMCLLLCLVLGLFSAL